MSGDLTIKIKKDNIWKYLTFVLAAIVIVILIWNFAGNSTSTTAGTGQQDNTGATAGDTIDESIFSDTSLYPALGPENADTVVMEFADFQCPYCALAAGLANWTEQYKAQYGDFVGVSENIKRAAENGDIRFVYVPLAFLGQESTYTAEAALCANDQGKFWELHDEIFAAHDSQENNGKYNKDKLIEMSKKISGLDQTEFKNCLESDKKLSDVQKATQTANSQGVSSTPTFFVNGRKAGSSWATIQAQL